MLAASESFRGALPRRPHLTTAALQVNVPPASGPHLALPHARVHSQHVDGPQPVPLTRPTERPTLFRSAVEPTKPQTTATDLAARPSAVLIENNARLPTSCIALRTALEGNLAEKMIRVFGGEPAVLVWNTESIRFSAAGRVWSEDQTRGRYTVTSES